MKRKKVLFINKSVYTDNDCTCNLLFRKEGYEPSTGRGKIVGAAPKEYMYEPQITIQLSARRSISLIEVAECAESIWKHLILEDLQYHILYNFSYDLDSKRLVIDMEGRYV